MLPADAELSVACSSKRKTYHNILSHTSFRIMLFSSPIKDPIGVEKAPNPNRAIF